jgi:hypothetical protein
MKIKTISKILIKKSLFILDLKCEKNFNKRIILPDHKNRLKRLKISFRRV